MKKLIYLIILIYLSNVVIFSQGKDSKKKVLQAQIVHQYIVQQAYQLLKYQYGADIPVMSAKVGSNEQGSGAFNPGGKMSIGAYREDEEDIVFSHDFPYTTSTHFWKADDGDGAFWNYGGILFQNAYQKANKYIYGGYEIRIYSPTGCDVYEAPSNLFSFYNNGSIYLKRFEDMLGRQFARDYWITAPQSLRDQIFWEVIGRVAHLIGDMGTPAHAHNSPHPIKIYGLDDEYDDDDMPSLYPNWNYYDALYAGGLIDVNNVTNPLKYLFYTTNQIADHFPSTADLGNNSNGINESFSNYPPLQDIINNLGTPPTSVDCYQIANTAFIYSIRATAGLFYWAARQIGLIQPINMPILVPYTYPTIEQALAAATSGNTVIVVTGTYNINNNITVPSGVTLVINAGVTLQFGSDNTLTVYGKLNAEGGVSPRPRITFTSTGSSIYWGGIIFSGSGANYSYLYCCDIRNVRTITGGTVSIINVPRVDVSYCNLSNCSLYNNSAIFINNSSSFIQKNRINSNYYGINCVNSANAWLSQYNGSYSCANGNNMITGNSYGLSAYSYSVITMLGASEWGTNNINNTGMNAIANNHGTIYGSYNFWGAYPPNTSKIYADNTSTIDYSNYQNCIPPDPPFSLKMNTISNGGAGTPVISNNIKSEDSLQLALLYIVDKKYQDALSIYKSIIERNINSKDIEKSLTGLLSIFRLTNDMEVIKYLENLPVFKDENEAVKLTAIANAYSVTDKTNMAFSLFQNIKNKYQNSSFEKNAMIQMAYLNYFNNKKLLTDNNAFLDELELKYKTDDEINALLWFIKNTKRNPKELSDSKTGTSNILCQNYPNPYNPVTTISYYVPKDGYVNIYVYDVLGREISKLIDKSMNLGNYSINFDGSRLASGTYYYKIIIIPNDGSAKIESNRSMQIMK
jgi:hypothetical protein